MVFSLAIGVSAAETGSKLELVVGNGKGTVTVDVYLQGNGITNGSITLSYDSSVLTLAEAKAAEALAKYSLNAEEPGTVTLAWVGSDLAGDKALVLSV